ncbi:MAG: type II secretion system F family protein [Bacillota bacterium]|nr:type II secretion system F family protein [Bacillota bacterium]
MLKLILFFTFTAVVLLIVGIHFLFTNTRRRISSRLETYTSKNAFLAMVEKQNAKAKLSFKEMLSKISKVFKSVTLAHRLEAELERADLPLKGEEFITLTLLAMTVPAMLVLLITKSVIIAVLFIFLGFIIPNTMLKSAQAKRLAQLNNQMGDTLVMMANSLRAGFSFFQAMDLISKEMPAPISQEFNRVLREMNLGTPTEEAIEKMGQRVKSEDMDMAITAVLIQRQVGGNLAEVLDKISHTIRERVRIKGEVKTLTAQGRISGVVIGLLPVALLAVLLIINQSYAMMLFTHPIGLILLIGGAFSEIMGILLIQKIVNIKI